MSNPHANPAHGNANTFYHYDYTGYFNYSGTLNIHFPSHIQAGSIETNVERFKETFKESRASQTIAGDGFRCAAPILLAELEILMPCFGRLVLSGNETQRPAFVGFRSSTQLLTLIQNSRHFCLPYKQLDPMYH